MLRIQIPLVAVCLGTEAFRLLVLHMSGNYVMPILVGPGDLFPDFLIWVRVQFDHYGTTAFFQPGSAHFLYPPGASLIYAFFHLFGEARLPVFIASMTGLFVAPTCLFARALVRRGVPPRAAALRSCVLLACAYPVWFAFQRGNIEFEVWAICALGMWALLRGRGYSAAACFGLAASMKFYPGIYLGLLIAKRRWKELFLGVGVFAVVSLLSLWLMYPDVAESLRQTRIGLGTFNTLYIQHFTPAELGWDHSLLGLYKRFGPGEAGLPSVAGRYTLLAAVGGVLLWLGRILRLPLPSQVVALTTAMILLPPVSFDYTLLHLYTAFGFALFSMWAMPVTRSSLAVFSCLAVATAPLSEIVWHGETLEGQMKALILSVLFVLALCWKPFEAAAVDGDGRPSAAAEWCRS